ncbi:hypothetical protein E2I00_008874, partial [Balaenoptera physalus]
LRLFPPERKYPPPSSSASHWPVLAVRARRGQLPGPRSRSHILRLCDFLGSVLAMNASRGRRQEAAGPKGRRAHRPREQVPELELIPLEAPQALPLMLTPQTPAPIVYSGMRPNCEVAVFINGPLALAGNADGVLPPKYFKEALQLRPTRKPLSLAGNEETECQSDPKHSSRGRRMTQQ